MILISILLIPLLSILFISIFFKDHTSNIKMNSIKNTKIIALVTSILILFMNIVTFIVFDFWSNQFQFIQESHTINGYTFYLGLDNVSIYYTLLITIVVTVALLLCWISILKNIKWYVIIILLLETFLLAEFLVLDISLFGLLFTGPICQPQSILLLLFILIVLLGSSIKVKASSGDSPRPNKFTSSPIYSAIGDVNTANFIATTGLTLLYFFSTYLGQVLNMEAGAPSDLLSATNSLVNLTLSWQPMINSMLAHLDTLNLTGEEGQGLLDLHRQLSLRYDIYGQEFHRLLVGQHNDLDGVWPEYGRIATNLRLVFLQLSGIEQILQRSGIEYQSVTTTQGYGYLI